MEKVNTIIIGAGQSGLSLSYFLRKKGIAHLILEKGRVGEEWRSRRWDNFHLITPNNMTRLPGFPYKGKNPRGFDSRDQMVIFFEKYAKFFEAPVLENTQVTSVIRNKDGFFIKTNKDNFLSKNLVVAIGSFHKSFIPTLSKSLPKNILQIHSSEYKNSEQLPEGSVLVVGGGNSGIQIAADLNKSGKKVYLSVGKLRIVPRHYRGKDFMEWAELLGALDKTTAEATPEVKNTIPPLLFGTNETVDLKKLINQGIQFLGYLTGVKNNKLLFDNNLEESLEQGEAALVGFKKAVDQFIETKILKASKEEAEDTTKVIPRSVSELNANDNQITSVIWATGFEDDWKWLQVNTFDENGEPVHKKGVSKVPGLYFIGLRWLSKYKSFLLCGVGEDAQFIANQIES